MERDSKTIRQVVGIPNCAIEFYIPSREVFRTTTKSKIQISASDEILIFLIWFRHYIPDCLLAIVFHIPQTTIQECRTRMLQWFDDLTKPQISAHSWKWRQQSGATRFWDGKTWLSFLVDGSEQKCYSAQDMASNILLYSGKKGHPSLTILLWVTLSGRVIHLSRSFVGSKNDPILLESERV